MLYPKEILLVAPMFLYEIYKIMIMSIESNCLISLVMSCISFQMVQIIE